VAATFVDADAFGCLPLLLWAGALGYLGWRHRPLLRPLAREPLVGFVLLNLLVQALATGAVFGPETAAYFGILRYMPHLLVAAIVAGFVVLNSAVRSTGAYLAIGAVALATNFLTLAHWTEPMGRKTPASWLAPVYAEVFHPPESPWQGAIARLRAEASLPSGRDKVVVVWPPWTKETMIFYLGDLAFIRQSSLSAAPTEANRLIPQVIGAEAARRLSVQPEWLVDLVGIFQVVPGGYAADGVFPSLAANPDNGSRPELTRHSFAQGRPVGAIRIFRLRPE
jgi:hypothetical protein